MSRDDKESGRFEAPALMERTERLARRSRSLSLFLPPPSPDNRGRLRLRSRRYPSESPLPSGGRGASAASVGSSAGASVGVDAAGSVGVAEPSRAEPTAPLASSTPSARATTPKTPIAQVCV